MAAKAFFAWHGDTCVLKLKGVIRFTDCPSIDKFIKTTISQNDKAKILVDLSDTELLDSTALGMIAQIAIYAKEKHLEKPSLIIDNKDLMTLFRSVCFDKVFSIIEPENEEHGIDFSSVVSDNSDDNTLASQVQESHQHLMKLSYANRLSFQEVMEALDKQGEVVQD